MTLGIADVLQRLTDHAKRTGEFEAVLDYEPISAPAKTGVTVGMWVAGIQPASSGLSATSVRLDIMGRLYRNAFAPPQSDVIILRAFDKLAALLSGDYTLGGTVRQLDLLGAEGAPFVGTAGYDLIDNKIFRMLDFGLSVIINDLWTQAP